MMDKSNRFSLKNKNKLGFLKNEELINVPSWVSHFSVLDEGIIGNLGKLLKSSIYV